MINNFLLHYFWWKFTGNDHSNVEFKKTVLLLTDFSNVRTWNLFECLLSIEVSLIYFTWMRLKCFIWLVYHEQLLNMFPKEYLNILNSIILDTRHISIWSRDAFPSSAFTSFWHFEFVLKETQTHDVQNPSFEITADRVDILRILFNFLDWHRWMNEWIIFFDHSLWHLFRWTCDLLTFRRNKIKPCLFCLHRRHHFLGIQNTHTHS